MHVHTYVRINAHTYIILYACILYYLTHMHFEKFSKVGHPSLTLGGQKTDRERYDSRAHTNTNT